MITVICIQSLSYSGTSWINLLLGSHPKAIALGPPDRLANLTPREADTACLIHGKDCPLLPDFVRNWNRDESLVVQLAEHCQRELIVLNNPSADFRERHLDDSRIRLVPLFVTRDGRANTFSVMRHHPDRHASFGDAAQNWFLPAIERLSRRMRENEESLHIRYEDFVEDWKACAGAVGERTGYAYADDAVEYWKYDHHLVAGNTGVIDTIHRLRGKEGFDHRRSSFYQAATDAIKRSPGTPIIDDQWRATLTDDELGDFDRIAGGINEALGYPRIVDRSAHRSAVSAEDVAARETRRRASSPGPRWALPDVRRIRRRFAKWLSGGIRDPRDG